MALFDTKKKPVEAIKALKEAVLNLEKPTSKKLEKINEEILKALNVIKGILYAHPDEEIANDGISVLFNEMKESNLVELLITSLGKLDLEAKKEFVNIYAYMMKKRFTRGRLFAEYIYSNPQILDLLFTQYSSPELSLNVGMLLRESAKSSEICIMIMRSQNFYQFFKLIKSTSFDVSSDAFLTFKEILSRHKEIVVNFLTTNFDLFFENYHKMVVSENYVTKRQSLKFLAELLVQRHNYDVLLRYVKSSEYLKMVMTLLKDPSASVQFEAFHIFKIFVVNPNRSKQVTAILCRNRDLLIDYLTSFHTERKDDEQFIDEKEYVIRQIREMKDNPS